MELFGDLYLMRMISSVFFAGILCLLVHFYRNIWWKSERVRRKLRMQGIQGPTPSILYGNLPEMQKIQSNTVKAEDAKSKPANRPTDIVAHDYTCTLFPYFEQWRKQYGPVYTYSTGMRQHLYVNQPELVKEMNQSISLDLGKPSYVTKRLAPMLGNGILRSNGHIWAQQRKIVAPEFFMEKVKGMVGLMVESALPLIRKWQDSIDSIEFEANSGGLKAADIRVDEDLRGMSADVISRACFGSSYLKGKEIFSKLRSLQKAISKQSFLFGVTSFASRFLSTKKQKEISNLEREIESLIWDTVKERECLTQTSSSSSSSENEKDLMQLILEGAVNDEDCQSVGKSKDSFVRFIVDNCKSIYFAGHESTAVAASWTLMLLALHPEWQARIRTELSQVCGPDSIPDADSLFRLKTVSMVIQESLRLYPPAAFVSREALEDTEIGDIKIPKGVCLWTLIPTLHRDPEIWGEDANEFKPERFSEGVTKACKFHPAYVPFGVGPRLCLGKNFAMVQLKIIISLIVSKFRFSLSPDYQHSPVYRMIVEPRHGVHILFQNG